MVVLYIHETAFTASRLKETTRKMIGFDNGFLDECPVVIRVIKTAVLFVKETFQSVFWKQTNLIVFLNMLLRNDIYQFFKMVFKALNVTKVHIISKMR